MPASAGSSETRSRLPPVALEDSNCLRPGTHAPPAGQPQCHQALLSTPSSGCSACHAPGDLVVCRPATDRSLLARSMKKGEATRRRIVAQAAGLLNTQGYRSTPVSEIMRITGLRKGGIYRHFDSRTELTLEAFQYGVARMRDRFRRALEGRVTATDSLRALLGVFREASEEEVFHGGCPIMNLAIESDDADPALRRAARQAT